MLHIISYQFQKNTAATNRLLAMISSISKSKRNACVHFAQPAPNFDMVEKKYPGITINYCWCSLKSRNRYLHKLLYKKRLKKIRKQLKPGDSVFLYGLSSQVGFFQKIKDVKVYHETTESPLVIPPKNIHVYLRECKELDGLFVISTALKDYFVQEGVPEQKVVIINMIVDPTRFINVQRNSEEKYIGYCGNVSNTKDGVDLLIKACAIVFNKYPNYKLMIIGKNPTGEAALFLKGLIEKNDIVNNVVFTGEVSADKMPQMLCNAEMLALCRPDSLQAQTGFPTKLGEYLLTRNPVIVTAVGDIPLFLKDGVSALISKPGDVEAFADKILWAIENNEKAKAIGENGYNVAIQYFNSDTETKKMMDYMNL